MGRSSFFGWRVVGAAFVTAVFAWGIGFYGPPIFLEVLHRTRGWPVPLVSAAITVHFLSGAALVARLAMLHRRFGIVATTRAGAVLTGVGALCWAEATSPWLLFPAALVSGAGWALTSGAAINAMVSPWFVRRRPAALGMAFNGASLGGVVFSPLWVVLIEALGFARAAAAVAVAVTVVLWLLSGRYLGRDPAAMGVAPDGDASTPPPTRRLSAAALVKPWRDRRFVTLAVSTTMALIAQIGLIAHLFSYLAPRLGEHGAGVAMASVTACAIGGRSLLGWLMPAAADRRLIAAANIGVQLAGSAILLLAGEHASVLLLGSWLFGIGLGNVVSLPPLVAQIEFRPADVPRVVAVVTAVSQAGYAFAPGGFGLLLSLGGGGTALFLGALLLQAAGIFVVLLGRRQAVNAMAPA